MTQQPEALRLADRLDLYATGDAHQQDIEQAAAELRRLHEVEVAYGVMMKQAESRIAAEREAVCRIVTGLCISDNNAEEINRAIRARGQT
jgi:hypothetical protein